ncbi:MAG TPA: hypothetical protein VFQ00_00715 [Terriglobales bacterium]|nr:hypothetical protein [Terriglobales bacterium]
MLPSWLAIHLDDKDFWIDQRIGRLWCALLQGDLNSLRTVPNFVPTRKPYLAL